MISLMGPFFVPLAPASRRQILSLIAPSPAEEPPLPLQGAAGSSRHLPLPLGKWRDSYDQAKLRSL
jgi:hypothetical protein